MYKLADNRVFNWIILLKEPKDNGEFEEHQIKVCYRRKRQSELTKLMEDYQLGITSERDILDAIFVDFVDGIEGGPSDPKEFRERMLDEPGVVAAIVSAYSDAIAGISRKK